MKFLQQAEQYAMDRGNAEDFRHWYETYRAWHNVEDSTWYALAWLYDDTVANSLVSNSHWPKMQKNADEMLQKVRLLKQKNANLMNKIKRQEFCDDASANQAIAEHAAEVKQMMEIDDITESERLRSLN